MTGTMQDADRGVRLVELRAAGKTYREGTAEVVALRPATCTVLPADRIAVVGPSGSGKSTLLQLMAGLEDPTVGAIVWPGLGGRESLRPGQVAVIFQQPSLLAPLSVVENVELPLLLNGVAPAFARSAALAALDRLDMALLADRLPEELSGGQMQRVAVARALAIGPKLILADEPTGQLDHATADHVMATLLAAIEGTNTALVLATHDASVAARLNRRWRMDHGLLQVDA